MHPPICRFLFRKITTFLELKFWRKRGREKEGEGEKEREDNEEKEIVGGWIWNGKKIDQMSKLIGRQYGLERLFRVSMKERERERECCDEKTMTHSKLVFQILFIFSLSLSFGLENSTIFCTRSTFNAPFVLTSRSGRGFVFRDYLFKQCC